MERVQGNLKKIEEMLAEDNTTLEELLLCVGLVDSKRKGAFVYDFVHKLVDYVIEKHGIQSLTDVIPKNIWEAYIDQFRVAHWIVNIYMIVGSNTD